MEELTVEKRLNLGEEIRIILRRSFMKLIHEKVQLHFTNVKKIVFCKKKNDCSEFHIYVQRAKLQVPTFPPQMYYLFPHPFIRQHQEKDLKYLG